ncbi:hypothetical protein CYMTET_10998 [Cymbomonas tetramitiformis]|uniref:J domain-containing protein n=1 Tax=Cymbomonas tetramitiformis TaxID=36881 RepID=A0AAE0GN67_9CHLO|nr:hypothetical protein CYMTET_10998 [Cymbomonas tetramitiformis]
MNEPFFNVLLSVTNAKNTATTPCKLILGYYLNAEEAKKRFEAKQRESVLGPSSLWEGNKHAVARQVYLPFYLFTAKINLRFKGTVGLKGPNEDSLRWLELHEWRERNGIVFEKSEKEMQVYGSYRYRRQLGKAAAVGPLVEHARSFHSPDVHEDQQVDELTMSPEVAWRIALSELHVRATEHACDILREDFHVTRVKDVKISLEVLEKQHTTVLLPAFVLDYTYLDKVLNCGRRVGQEYDALISGATGFVQAKAHMSPLRAQVYTGAVFGFAALTEMAIDPAVTSFTSMEGVFCLAIASTLARGAVHILEMSMDTRDQEETQLQEEMQAEAFNAAWSGLGYLSDELLWQLEEKEWDRWAKHDAWTEAAMSTWAEDLLSQQTNRREGMVKWHQQQSELRRQREEQMLRDEVKRRKYGGGFRGRVSRPSERSPRDYLGYFAVLGLQHTIAEATDEDIKAAFRRKAMELHPDRFKEGRERVTAAESFKKLQEAYQVLKDPVQRSAYIDRGRM